MVTIVLRANCGKQSSQAVAISSLQQLLNSVNTEIGLKLWPIGFMENAFEFDSISQNIEMRLDDASER